MRNIVTIPFQEHLIEGVAQLIVDEYRGKGSDFRRIAVVFGGRRPALFLRQMLSGRLKSVYVPPRFFTIDEWMDSIAPPRRRMSDLDHCFVVHQLVRQHAHHMLKGKDDFVHFLPWAREIIHFMEQLDLEDTSPQALKTLREHAAIGFNVPEDINRLLESLMALRQYYHEYLDRHQCTTRGYQYLQASRRGALQPYADFDQVLFCNFFYLHRTEQAVIKDLFDRRKASLIVQGDQRRWPALQKMAMMLGEELTEGKTVRSPEFQLHLYAAFDMHAQAGMIAEIIKKIPDPSKAVIVLPQPEFMLPLLSMLGDQVAEFNVSMGYPLRRSSLYALLSAIIEAQTTIKDGLYYARNYVRVLRHPFLQTLDFALPPGAVRAVVHQFQEVLTGRVPSALSGRLYLDIKDILADDTMFAGAEAFLNNAGTSVGLAKLKDLFAVLHETFFNQWNHLTCFGELARTMEQFADVIEKGSGHAYPFNDRVIQALRDIAQEWSAAQFALHVFEGGDLLRIMDERLQREIIAFSGSPLRGLQILGLLETRSLNFEHVVIADVNEHSLPNLNIYEPLIPREVMVNMNIDRLELEEEIQRYQFMRLISGARQVHLVYQERADKERSRFIEELVWEKEQQANRLDAVPIVRPAFQVALTSRRNAANKTPEIIEFLRRFCFSPTSIMTYRRNPYEFYENYVLGLREQDDLLDDPDGRSVGTFVHEALEQGFRPLVGRRPLMDDDFRRHFSKVMEACFFRQFGQGVKSDAFLVKAVLDHRMARFMECESARLEQEVAEIICLERPLEDTLMTLVGPLRFRFRIDRIDRLKDGAMMVIDYKTGQVDGQSLQMPLYLHGLAQQYPDCPIQAAYYNMRTATLDKCIKLSSAAERQKFFKDFRVELDAVMAELFNPEIPFADPDLELE